MLIHTHINVIHFLTLSQKIMPQKTRKDPPTKHVDKSLFQ